jgi:RNA polymerase sigma-70 factor (ECF subfamily)
MPGLPHPSPRPPLRVVTGDARRGVAGGPGIAARPPTSVDDLELADALVAGEPWAATATWNKHAPMVSRFLRRALGPHADVEDLTQEVFVGLFAGARALRHREALRSYIYSIAVRTLKWELRRRRARAVLHLTGFDQLPDQAVPALDAESRQALRRFYAILDRLSAQERTAFVLRHMEGCKLGEVAEALGVSLATAKRRLSTAAATVSRFVDRDPALAGYAPARDASGLLATDGSDEDDAYAATPEADDA